MAEGPPRSMPDLNIDVRSENAKLLFPERRWITASPEDDATAATRPRVRKLVLCFDGTGNQSSDKNSNVLQIFKCLRKDDETQLTYYQEGFGTESNKALARNIETRVQDVYRFLMQNYKPGDKISLFGFSGGAYTVCLLCRFVQKVGLLLPDNDRQIPVAWEVFARSDDEGDPKKCADYKRDYSLSVKFDFLGVWDAVASFGTHGKELPFAKHLVSNDIRVFRHALALDERDEVFRPNFKPTSDGLQSELEMSFRDPVPNEALGNTNERSLDRRVREVWFAGCHSDVGGGSELNPMRNSLARIPLRWMIRECFRADTGIIFDKDMLVDIGFGATPCYEDSTPTKWDERRTNCKSAFNKNEPATSSAGAISSLSNVIRRGKSGRGSDTEPELVNEHVEEPGHVEITVNEHREELHDALFPIHDQLSDQPSRRLLKLLYKDYRDDSKKVVNLGKGREIYGDAWNTTKDQGELKWYIEVHESVRTRIKEYEGPKSKRYKPLAWFCVPGANGQNASVSEFRWEGEFEKMCASQAGQMIRWVK